MATVIRQAQMTNIRLIRSRKSEDVIVTVCLYICQRSLESQNFCIEGVMRKQRTLLQGDFIILHWIVIIEHSCVPSTNGSNGSIVVKISELKRIIIYFVKNYYFSNILQKTIFQIYCKKWVNSHIKI